ncbi:hypothetical protein BASA50_009308 [Batrachochytrium salamandrivorans]|uniref:Tail specific protease domain-containing protein n=1 Tax=Batrachochytrium salamandrivorans TaxID=1357716 RepID=A0ABQ8F4Y5_9FUNG|nr:hypothetical protein BASA50_009308 [Batrachochytrium salamandrivorans]
MLVSSVITLLVIGFTSVSADKYDTYNLLKDDRAAGRLVFIPTTLAQKEVILSNVKNALAIWVNHKSKIDHYGSAADPFPIVKKLRETINTVSDEELQLGITDAFAMTRDRHTRWTTMPPYSCFYATTDVEFAFIEGDDDIAKNPTVVVTSTSEYPDLRLLFGEDYSKIQAGDELLAINGLSFVDWFEKNKFKYGFGANDFGGQRTALDYLTTIYGETNRLPSEDFIKFQFKSHANPDIIYTVDVPYVSGRNEECWNLGSKLYKSLPSRTLPGTPETSLPVSAEQSGHNQESDTAHLSPRGYEMDSPEDPEREADMDQISSSRQKSVVSDESNRCDRSHLGWYIDFANNMVQLFKPDFQPFGDRYLMNKITQNIFFDNKILMHVHLPRPGKNQGWQETEPSSRFTNVFFPNSVKSANTLGQAYLRPMGILNDAKCYSSCEVFSGSIQGHDAGTIFGEDKQTGGGGATVVKLDPWLILSPRLFALVVYNGQTIEDVGIEPEIIVRPRWSDLQPDPTTNTQYDRIAERLARIGQENGQSKLHFVCEPFDIEKPLGKFSLEVESAGIEKFTVTLGNNRITIVGKTAGVQVLKTKRNVRTIPTNDKYMKISTHGFTFTGTSDSVGLYQSPTTAPADGWNNLRGPWMIGNGVQYVGGIDSSIEAFFAAPIGTKINVGIDVDLDTEPGCDFLYLSVKSSGGVEDFLLRSKSLDGKKTFNGISGRKEIVKGTAPFTTKSERFSVSLRFTSDEATAFAGATINSLTVSAA